MVKMHAQKALDEYPGGREEYLCCAKKNPRQAYENLGNPKNLHSAEQNRMNTLEKMGFAVLSMSRQKNIPSLWAHYANNGQGFVVGIDPEHKYFSEKLVNIMQNELVVGWRPVKYSNKRKSYYLQSPNPNGETCLDAILYKSLHWKYEREIRLVINHIHELFPTDPIGLFELPMEAIREIILGYDVKSYIEKLAFIFCRENNIPLLKAEIARDQYEYIFKEVDVLATPA